SCLRSNEEEAWGEFLRRFQPLLAAVAARTIRRWARPSAALVDDLVQSSLRKIFDNNCRAMRGFRWLHDNSFRGFLKVVASNVVQDHFRKYPPSRVEEDLEQVSPEIVKTEPLSQGVETEALVRKLVACLQKLLSAEQDLQRNLAMFLL